MNEVALKIAGEITGGQLQQGDYLPDSQELQNKYGTSAEEVDSSLATLSYEGNLERIPFDSASRFESSFTTEAQKKKSGAWCKNTDLGEGSCLAGCPGRDCNWALKMM